MTLEIVQIDLNNAYDNYNYILRCTTTNTVATVDPTDAGRIAQELADRGWSLDFILNTHHHFDHTGGNLELKDQYQATIIGPTAEADKIPGIDQAIGEGDSFQLGDAKATIFDIPGHTLGHIAYYFDTQQVLFCGDTLFSIGCGRMFEGTPKQFWTSLLKLRDLPDETMVFCAHEYTKNNGEFALSIDPKNSALIARMEEVKKFRAQGIPTVPSSLGQEKTINPFLRADQEAMKQLMSLPDEDDHQVFAAIRRAKDVF